MGPAMETVVGAIGDSIAVEVAFQSGVKIGTEVRIALVGTVEMRAY